MKFRSEWITIALLTGLAIGGMTLSKPNAPRRDDLASAGVDFTPVGVAHSGLKAKAPHLRH